MKPIEFFRDDVREWLAENEPKEDGGAAELEALRNVLSDYCDSKAAAICEAEGVNLADVYPDWDKGGQWAYYTAEALDDYPDMKALNDEITALVMADIAAYREQHE